MPIQGKYNGGQKALFWAAVVCVLVLFVSGLAIWREYFSALLPIGLVRFASLLHAVFASVLIALITVHVYAAIWVKGTIRAMWYGTVTRAWAKQHHAAWYREMTGRKS
jgi:formate dehydrogenase subunit gamma